MGDTIDWEQAILETLAQRNPPATLCPSEVARKVAGKNWRKHMQEVRDAAVILAKQRAVCISQGGVPVSDLDSFRGPIRIGHFDSREYAP